MLRKFTLGTGSYSCRTSMASHTFLMILYYSSHCIFETNQGITIDSSAHHIIECSKFSKISKKCCCDYDAKLMKKLRGRFMHLCILFD